MISTLLIALREGLEASLIIGILVAYLVRSDRRRQLPYLWLGVGAAIALSLGLGAFLSFTSTELSTTGEEVFAGTSSLAAVALVTWMVFWMKRNARSLRDDLHSKVDESSSMGNFGLIAAAFFAVAREGLETALFIYSNFKTVSSNSAPTIGLVLGLALAVGLGIGIYRRSIKINLGKFFTVTGSALLVVAAGVLSHGINEFQQFGALPGAHGFAWNWQGGSDSVLTTILDGTIGISTSITWVQLFIWALYLGATLRFYLKKAPVRTPIAA
jgi:high-affinity iron transporter